MKSILIPPFLEKGNTIAIVSTARKITAEELAPAIAAYQEAGFQIRLGNTVGKSYDQFAGTDEERLQDFQEMLDDPEVKAIVCARGGYGTARFVDLINFSTFKKNPKWVVGYSDVTVLHCHIVQNYSIATLHATMPLHMLKRDQDLESFNSLIATLKGEIPGYKFDPHPLNRTGNATGQLIGGNLSIIYNLTGTPSESDMAGRILFIEDIDEYLYHIDRMMVTLKRAGKLKNLAGLIVGGMTGMNDNIISFGKTAEEIIREHVDEYNYPVAFGFPVGHGMKNLALIEGSPAELHAVVGNKCRLTYL